MIQTHNSAHAKGLVRLTPIVVGILSVGCGGSGGGSADSGGAGHTTNVGSTVVSYIGHPQAAVEGTNGLVSAVGQAGAAYTTIADYPTPSLASTFLLFTRNVAGGQIYTMPATGYATPTAIVHASASGYASVSDAGVIAYLLETNGTYGLNVMRTDGSNAHTVKLGVAALPSISASGTTIAYLDAAGGNLWSIPATGGTATEIYSGGNAYTAPVWSPSGTQLAFTAKNATTGYLNVYTMPAAGGAVTDVTPANAAVGNTTVSSWSPDGATLGCTYQAKGSSLTGVLTLSTTVGVNNLLTPSTYSDISPSFSPDGREIAFYRSNAGGATAGIYVEDFAGLSPQLILPDPPSTGLTGPVVGLVWSPYLENQKFVGSGGTLSSTNVSGYLMSQVGSQFASMLTFTATTPSAATITPPSIQAGTAPLIYTLNADSITNISFTNSYNGTHTSLALTTTPTAIVSIDGATGQVDMLAPGIVHGAPALAHASASSVTYSGQFSAVYDGTGKNLAPGGASTLVVDPATGKLLSYR